MPIILVVILILHVHIIYGRLLLCNHIIRENVCLETNIRIFLCLSSMIHNIFRWCRGAIILYYWSVCFLNKITGVVDIFVFLIATVMKATDHINVVLRKSAYSLMSRVTTSTNSILLEVDLSVCSESSYFFCLLPLSIVMNIISFR